MSSLSVQSKINSVPRHVTFSDLQDYNDQLFDVQAANISVRNERDPLSCYSLDTALTLAKHEQLNTTNQKSRLTPIIRIHRRIRYIRLHYVCFNAYFYQHNNFSKYTH